MLSVKALQSVESVARARERLEYFTGDVYFSIGYLTATAEIEQGLPYLVEYSDGDERVSYLFYKRRIPGSLGYYDIISPYGYSGPLLQCSERAYRRFRFVFNKWCRDEHIVAEFVRYNPFDENHRFEPQVNVQLVQNIVVVDLDRPLEKIKAGFRSQNRRNIRTAIKSGLEFYETNVTEGLERFILLYYETMERLGASSFYYFRPSYFEQLHSYLGNGVHLFCVEQNGDVAAMALCLRAGSRLHYHLGASDPNYFSARPNNFMFWKIIEWAHERGLKLFNLGGGRQGADSLRNFKAQFSDTVLPFYCGKCIHDAVKYHQLAEQRQSALCVPATIFERSMYFPLYRFHLPASAYNGKNNTGAVEQDATAVAPKLVNEPFGSLKA